ncbi:MAG: peptide ABC transporter substrate-binding protein [Lachnospiraceae bacterium]|nr:peptide ABC transporter substrate-binding protein [Lachnospiraceae bacterium]
MRSNSLKMIISVLLCATLFLSGCGGTGKPKADPGKELTVNLGSIVISADPQLVADMTSLNVCMTMAGTLYKYDRNDNLVPCLAESYEVSDDGLVWTYHLRDGAGWSNGEEVTAGDFVFAFQRLVDPETGSQNVIFLTDYCRVRNAREISSGEMDVSSLGVRAEDPKTLVVELEEPCPYLNALFTNVGFAPCNREFFYSCNGDYATSPDTMLSSGPFKVDSYEPMCAQIHFSKNEYYVDSDDIKLQGVTMYTLGNSQQSMMCFEKGEMDVFTIGGELLEKYKDDPRIVNSDGLMTVFLVCSNKEGPFKNIKIRRAISKSVDRDNIVKNVFRTGYKSNNRLLFPGFYDNSDGSDFGEKNAEWYDSMCGYDPDEAVKLWEEGLKEEGISSLNLEIGVTANSSLLIEALKSQIESNLPGISINARILTSKQWIQDLQSPKQDLMYSAWAADYVDPSAYLNYFVKGDDRDPNVYYSETFIDLCRKAGSAEACEDPAMREELLQNAEKQLVEDMAFIPLFSGGISYAISDKVSGLYVDPLARGLIYEGTEKETDQ